MKHILVLALACSASPKPVAAPSSEPVVAWVTTTLAQFERGDPTIFADLDPDGAFMGVAFPDVWDASGFATAQRDMVGKAHDPWHIKSGDLRVALTPDGQAAWFSDLLAWDEGKGPIPIRWTGVLVRRAGRWALSASHASVGVPNARAAQQAGEGQMPSPGTVPPKLDADGKPLVAMFDADLASTAQWIKDISTRDDAYVIGSDPSEVWLGPAAIEKGFDDDTEHHATIARTGEPHARVAGQIGWVMANVRVDVGNGKPLPLRLLAVYLREADGWKMVQLHASTAVLH